MYHIFFLKRHAQKREKKLNDQLNDEIPLHNPCTLKDLKVHRQSIANQFTFQFCTGQKKQDRANETILKSHTAAHLDFVLNTSFFIGLYAFYKLSGSTF